MKKITTTLQIIGLTIALSFLTHTANAQTMGLLYGMTSFSGDSGEGTIYYYDALNSVSKKVYAFGKVSGGGPSGDLIQGTDGNLYGMTFSNGANKFGTIFKFNPSNNTLTVIHDFDSVHGKGASASLIQATDGNLYGMTPQGGTSNDGVLFKCSTTGTYSVMVNFTGTSGGAIGAAPYGSLMEASDNNLYGTTSGGGTSGNGTIFKYTLAGVYSVLVNFTGSSGLYIGSNPRGTLVQEPTYGYLYGLTYRGGSSDDGTVFYVTTGGTFSNIASFTGSNGQYPFGKLVEVTDASFEKYFYGMTAGGGSHNDGTIFNFQAPPNTPTLSTVYNFTSSASGAGNSPYGSLMLASNDSLYGTTYTGGPGFAGTLFQWDFSAGLIKNSVVFNGATLGADPDGCGVLEALTATIAVTTPSCASQILTANVRGGSSPYLYSWTGGATSSSITGITASGTYSVTVTDNKGISVVQSVTLTAYTPLGASTGSTRTSCHGTSDGTATVIATGGTPPYTYSWTPSSQTTQTATGLAAGPYNILVTDALNCTTTGSTSVPQPGVLSTAVSTTATSCFGSSDGTATASPTGGTQPYSYGWTPSGGSSISASGLVATNYTLTVDDSSNCEATKSFSISQPNLLTDSVKAVVDVSCFGGNNGSANVIAYGGTGPYTYLWTGGTTSTSISGLIAGSYTVTVNDAHTCNPASAVATIGQPAAALNGAISGTNISCKGYSTGSVTETVTGGTSPYTYLWTGGATSSTVNALVAGPYTVTVLDKNGCSTNSNTTLTEPSTLLTVNTTTTAVKCYGGSDGTATATASNGGGGYQYLWSGGATTSAITGLPATTYSIAVTDNNGCTINSTAKVIQPANTLPNVHICVVTVDTASTHNIVIWDKSAFADIDSLKLYYENSLSQWQLIQEVPFSAPNYIVDNTPINNPNGNTVRYALIGVDSCGNQESIAASPWQNTCHINEAPKGTFTWSGTGYLKQGVTQPVVTYYLYRDSLSNGKWKAIDSISGSQNTMSDAVYQANQSNYPYARWRVEMRLNDSIYTGCTEPNLRPQAINYNASKSNTITVSSPLNVTSLNVVKDNVTVYPNPANQVLNIAFNYAKTETSKLSVVDIMGRTLIATENESTPGSTMQINVSVLPTGIYFVKVTTGTLSQVTKFIKE